MITSFDEFLREGFFNPRKSGLKAIAAYVEKEANDIVHYLISKCMDDGTKPSWGMVLDYVKTYMRHYPDEFKGMSDEDESVYLWGALQGPMYDQGGMCQVAYDAMHPEGGEL